MEKISKPMNIKELIISIIVIAIATLLFVLAARYGLSKAERAECLKWQKEAQQYEGYYLLGWQKSQCEHHGIEIEALIKTTE